MSSKAYQPKKIRIVGIPMDYGGDRRGTDMGPSAIRVARLEEALETLGHQVVDGGNIQTPEPETRKLLNPKARYVREIVTACEHLARRIERSLSRDELPICLGGDHSLAVGSVGGAARLGKPLALLWVDAHADFNTPEISPTGNVHGMPLAAITGRGPSELVQVAGIAPKVEEQRIALIGVRHIDPLERQALAQSQIHVYTMRDIDERGMKKVMDDALKQILDGVGWLHVSFDMDVIDPRWAPGIGTPVSGGITYREAHLIMEMISDTGVLRSLDVVEVNPILDERNRTAELAVGLICSALGARIL
jgi:arginase